MNFKEWLNEIKGQGLDSYVHNGMVDLYRYSSRNVSDTAVAHPQNFGQNSYTGNDIKAAKTPRVFFYVDIVDKENYFKQLNHVYTVSVPRKYIIDLTIDEGGHFAKAQEDSYDSILSVYDILFQSLIKAGFKGVFYEAGSLHIVNWFEPITLHKMSETDAIQKLGYSDMKDALEKEKIRYKAVMDAADERREQERLRRNGLL